MQEEKYAKAPLLYIQQPEVGESKVPMQHQYRSLRKKGNAKMAHTSNDAEQSNEPKPTVSYHSVSLKEEQTETVEGMENLETSTVKEKAIEQETDTEKRKHFKDMDTRGKLEYFANTSPYAPKVRCEIKTEDRTYRGVVVGFENDVAVFKTMKRNSPIEIPLAEIKDVRIIGF